jgi:hypothetical protein
VTALLAADGGGAVLVLGGGRIEIAGRSLSELGPADFLVV